MRVVLFCLAALLTTAVPGRGATGKESTGLDVVVLPTIQYAHEDIWDKTPTERGPATMAVAQVVRGQEVHILVFATNYAIAADQNAEVSYRLSFIRPDGKAGVTKAGLQLIPRGPAKDRRYVRKAAEVAVFIATKDDALGDWGVVVEATDLVGAMTVRREQHFTVVGDEVLEEPLPPETDQNAWFMGYHNKPVPQQLLAAIRLEAENPPARAKPRRDAEDGGWLGFFEQVVSDNPWLLPHVIARLEKSAGRERELLTTLLAYAKRDDRSFPEKQPAAVRDALLTLQDESWPVPTAEPLQGAQLDVLWGRFFASGRYEPIRALVAVLAYLPYKDALDEYKKFATKPAELPVEVYKSALFGAASWSLTSNIQQDKLVRDYCDGILLRKELPAAEHAWLAGIFRRALEDLKKTELTNPPAKKQD